MTDALGRLNSALSDRYTIERELGAGGMATVYLAHDLKHDRKVAIKVMRPELSAILGGERFLREIGIAAKLNHPHILALHDSGEAEEFLYYVMPYVEGESLRETLNRGKQLPVDEALKITSQVASALSYAHSRDIVHRDIKPENILFQVGEVVVADFGIALAVDSGGGTRLTETGLSLGTPAYMSPEQVSGEQEIDGRSDIYSLACVLYEMLAGDPPFLASSPQAVLAKHVTEPAPSVTTVRPSVPQAVAAAIARALDKARADRFASAKAFSEALFATDVETEEQKKSIVVLPFENLSPDPDNAFFADGLTEELIADLSRVRTLRVISRTSAMAFKDTAKTIPTIAQELKVRYALEGSVRKAGTALRITAQLIDADNDEHLWADKYSGTVDDVFDLQERLSRQIVEALEETLSPGEAGRPLASGAAYECYLRARYEIARWTESALDRAVQHLEAALEIEGENPFLLASVAQVHTAYIYGGFRFDEETRNAAERYANRALALDPAVAPAHGALGGLAYMTGDPKSAYVHLQQAVLLGTDDPNDLSWYLLAAGTVGRTSTSGPLVERLVQADPLNPVAHWCHAVQDWFEDRYEAALASVRVALRLDPNNVLNRCFGVYLMGANGRLDEARALLDEWLTDTPEHSWARSMPGYLYAFEGRHNESSSFLGRMLADEQQRSAARSDACGVLWIAQAYAISGEADQALEWLEHGLELGLINYPFLAEKDRFLAGLRGDLRFQRLMERVKKEWEEFEA